MPLYATFLARVPPGSQRQPDWSWLARDVSGAGFLFGDYDLHGHIRLDYEPPLQLSAERLRETTKLLALAPDHRIVLLSSIPGEPDPNLPDNWREKTKQYPLFSYVEVKLHDQLLHLGEWDILEPAALFIRETFLFEPPVEGAVSRTPREIEVATLFDLSASDVVAYLFGNDLECFLKSVLTLRKQTIGNFLDWLAVKHAGRWQALHEVLSKAERDRHFCKTTYTVYGRLVHPDVPKKASAAEIARSISQRVTSKLTSLRPLVFLSTFPGHEREKKLREALRANTIGNAATGISSGLFDLVHCVLDPMATSAPQNEIVEKALLLIDTFWGEIGPRGNLATVLRTNTVWMLPERLDTPPDPIVHHAMDAQTSHEPAATNSTEPASQVLELLERAFAAVAANHLAPAYAFVQDIEPFLAELRRTLDQQITKHGPLLSTADGRDALEVFDDVLSRMGAALSTRTYCTSHALREEITVFPGASFHKLLAMYTTVLRRVATSLKPMVGSDAIPPYLVTLGGVYPARSHSYFVKENQRPPLVIFEIAGANLLHPDQVLFGLTHELMHVVAPRWAMRHQLASSFLKECAIVIAEAAIEGEIAPKGATRLDLVAVVEKKLLTDHARELELVRDRPERGSYDCAEWLIDLCIRDVLYLAYLLGHDNGLSDEEATLTFREIERLEALRARLGREDTRGIARPEDGLSLSGVKELFSESLVDVLAAASTSFAGYSKMLQTPGTIAADRLVAQHRKNIVARVALAMEQGENIDDARSIDPSEGVAVRLAAAFSPIACEITKKQSRTHYFTALFKKLSMDDAWQWTNEDIKLLLDQCKDTR